MDKEIHGHIREWLTSGRAREEVADFIHRIRLDLDAHSYIQGLFTQEELCFYKGMEVSVGHGSVSYVRGTLQKTRNGRPYVHVNRDSLDPGDKDSQYMREVYKLRRFRTELRIYPDEFEDPKLYLHLMYD